MCDSEAFSSVDKTKWIYFDPLRRRLLLAGLARHLLRFFAFVRSERANEQIPRTK